MHEKKKEQNQDRALTEFVRRKEKKRLQTSFCRKNEMMLTFASRLHDHYVEEIRFCSPCLMMWEESRGKKTFCIFFSWLQERKLFFPSSGSCKKKERQVKHSQISNGRSWRTEGERKESRNVLTRVIISFQVYFIQVRSMHGKKFNMGYCLFNSLVIVAAYKFFLYMDIRTRIQLMYTVFLNKLLLLLLFWTGSSHRLHTCMH